MKCVIGGIEVVVQAAFSFKSCLCSGEVSILEVRIPFGNVIVEATRNIIIGPTNVMNVEGAVLHFPERVSARRRFSNVGSDSC